MTQEEKQDADRNYRNFHTAPSWTAYLNSEQTDYILQERGDFIFCNGRGRNIIAEPLTSNSYKLTTEAI